MSTNTVLRTLRIRKELYDKIVKLAEEDDRSINGEIVYLIKLGLTARERDGQEILKLFQEFLDSKRKTG